MPSTRSSGHNDPEPVLLQPSPATDKGLMTTIDLQNRDSRGEKVTPEHRARMHRLRMWQRKARLSDFRERGLAKAFSKLEMISSHLGLPRNFREEAALIIRRVQEKGVRGRSTENIAAAACYASCREHGIPRTFKEVARVSGLPAKEIVRSYMFIIRELKLFVSRASPADYVARFGSVLNIPQETQAAAVELIRKVEEKKATYGRSPITIAAAAIYIACLQTGERKVETEIAKATGITEVSLRNRKNEICEILDIGVSKLPTTRRPTQKRTVGKIPKRRSFRVSEFKVQNG